MKSPKKKSKPAKKPEIALRRFKFKALGEGVDVIFPIMAPDVDAALKDALNLCLFRNWEYKGRISRNRSAYERVR